ncbi:MAG: adenylate/guanylate cyclase domain-containing protein [Algoriphagus sp.]|uniref:adenylate/guanylate cyclase domain-containing protein n=1 Tax=Algoriphagus sp. TaxID=1872435 RepID=UPI001832F73F|nr:adenylate/guanylate cyclase domain-containing protein [Algoriphagus sp.]NVJ86473.1 adenylate/guanylate cyclase domain-containing protein [Algoriphagus sp.]
MKNLVFFFLYFSIFNLALAQSVEESNNIRTKADSIKDLYFASGEENLDYLASFMVYETNPDSLLKYGEIYLEKALRDSLDNHISSANTMIGYSYKFKGDLSKALEYFLESLKYAQKSGSMEAQGGAYITIADTYSVSENSQNAAIYYRKGIEILEQENDSTALGSAIFNAGDEYLKLGKLDSALLFIERAQLIFKKVNFELGQAYCLGNLGMIYAENGDKITSEKEINQAIEILEKYEDYYAISDYLNYLSNIYLEKGDNQSALPYALRSLDLASKYGLKDQISEANLLLSTIYEGLNNSAKALESYKRHIQYRDSVNNIQAVQEMANLRTDYEVSQKQAEVDLLESAATIATLRAKRQTLLLYGVLLMLILVALLAIGSYRRFQFENKTKKIIEEEKNRSDELLLNILPEEIADELKVYGKVKAHRFNSATVLFTDFKSFSTMAEQIAPEQLVESIDYYFKEFDVIVDKYGLEKIKTIGDSYMCAGGLPTETERHAFDVVHAAIEMMALIKKPKPAGIVQFEMRIGIHTGPIVAGIVGVKKWQYDIWGDTVNIASRMESNSEEGKINISGTTYEIIKDEFECEYRGSVEIKNRGIWDMYYLKT